MVRSILMLIKKSFRTSPGDDGKIYRTFIILEIRNDNPQVNLILAGWLVDLVRLYFFILFDYWILFFGSIIFLCFFNTLRCSLFNRLAGGKQRINADTGRILLVFVCLIGKQAEIFLISLLNKKIHKIFKKMIKSSASIQVQCCVGVREQIFRLLSDEWSGWWCGCDGGGGGGGCISSLMPLVINVEVCLFSAHFHWFIHHICHLNIIQMLVYVFFFWKNSSFFGWMRLLLFMHLLSFVFCLLILSYTNIHFSIINSFNICFGCRLFSFDLQFTRSFFIIICCWCVDPHYFEYFLGLDWTRYGGINMI